MKIAITSTGNDIESKVDQRFGRCSFFAIYNTDNEDVDFISNPNKDATEGAGPASVQIVASMNVSKIISGEYGVKIKSLLDNLQIQLIMLYDNDKSISEIIKILKSNSGKNK